MPQLMSVRKMAVALRLMDSFTGRIPRNANLYVRMEDGAVPVKKENGYYIFWDNGARTRKLLVRGIGYEPEEIVLDMESLSAKAQPTCCLWLRPDRSYVYPPEITWVKAEGQPGRPGEVREFVVEATAGCLRLTEPYPLDRLNPQYMHMFVPDDMELENRRLYIRAHNGNGECFTVWAAKNRAMGIYQLERPLEHIYGPYESVLYLTMALKADQEGRFLVPLHAGAETAGTDRG